MNKVVESGRRVVGKPWVAALIRDSKFSHVRLVRSTLIADVVAHKSETPPEMQFKPSVSADEFTPCEVSARPFALSSELELEPVGEKYPV